MLSGIPQPDLTGPSLARLVQTEAALANQGNTQAAAMLFKGFDYCLHNNPDLPADPQALQQKMAQMKATHEDMHGLPTSRLAAAITRFKESEHFCAGETVTNNPQQGKIEIATTEHWARIAAWSLNPRTLWEVLSFGVAPFLGKKKPTQAELNRLERTLTDWAARAGVVSALVMGSSMYSGGWYGVQKNPTRAFADMYTAYLLTRSPVMAYKIWKMSQGPFTVITVNEIQEGEAMARRNYQEIRERQSSISH